MGILPDEERWRFTNNSPYPWMPVLAAKLRPLRYPLLAGPTLMIYSDYGGGARHSRFETISLLFLDLEASGAWDTMRRLTRQEFLPDSRRMEYKGLNDSYKRRALPSFLDAANHLPGFCCVIAIDKRVRNMCMREDLMARLVAGGILQSKWGSKSIERMLRVVHFVSFFMAILTQPGQNVYWISDEDEMFANSERSVDTKRMLERFSSTYVTYPLGEVGLGTTKIDEEDRFDEDCAAVPDLVAGATAELLTSLTSRYGALPELPSSIPATISRKCETVVDWFFSSRSILVKCGVVVSCRKPGHYQLGTWTISDSLVNTPRGLWVPRGQAES